MAEVEQVDATQRDIYFFAWRLSVQFKLFRFQLKSYRDLTFCRLSRRLGGGSLSELKKSKGVSLSFFSSFPPLSLPSLFLFLFLLIARTRISRIFRCTLKFSTVVIYRFSIMQFLQCVQIERYNLKYIIS